MNLAHTSARRRFASLINFASFCALALVASVGRCQAPAIPTAEVRVHFQSAINALAAKWHVAIVAESVPITEVSGADLAAALPDESADRAATRIAAAFDYSVKRKGDVFVLNKLFTDPNDRPDVTLEEASAALDDMLQILPAIDAKYMPRNPMGGPIDAMRTVLTHEELAALDHGGVPVSSLTDGQRTKVFHVAEAVQYGRAIDDAREASYFIQQALAHDPELHWSGGPPENKEFGYDVAIVSRSVVGHAVGPTQSALTLDFAVANPRTGQTTIVHGGASILVTGGFTSPQ